MAFRIVESRPVYMQPKCTRQTACPYGEAKASLAESHTYISQQPQYEICMGCGAELYLGKCTNRNCDESRSRMQQSASSNL